ncbi:MAG: sulfurtransferase [Pseudomonadota bacterium]|nr:MAG: sulfurtransferase [Pseudomonadota bacterium]
MNDSTQLPLIIEPEALQALLESGRPLIVDLSQPETYIKHHVPGAVFLEYPWIVHRAPPVMGLLPDARQLSNVLGAVGLTPDTHVVAYDDEGGGRACRFLWTLDTVGHTRYSLLNGGTHAWVSEGHSVTDAIAVPRPVEYSAHLVERPVADRRYILDHMEDPGVAILDTRSPEEYSGAKVYAQRGGHIPGAVNLEWTRAMDKTRNLRLRPADELHAMLAALGITPDKTVITHCQTHHRSAHTYIVLKSLGFKDVRGYPGSWSEWGNRSDTPVQEGRGALPAG